jgi:molybdenum cofactor cytidylyltransferase
MPSEARPDRREGGVAGVLLAAGTSSRLGRNKLFLEHAGVTLLRRAATAALDAGLAPLLVVVGHEAERARAALGCVPCEIVFNPRYEDGIVTSLHAGLAALPATAAAVVVMLADMPFVTAEMIGGLVERYRTSTAPLVISDFEGVVAPPMLYDRALLPELFAIDDGRCGQQVVKRHRAEAEVLARPASALEDVDVEDDVERMQLSERGAD